MLEMQSKCASLQSTFTKFSCEARLLMPHKDPSRLPGGRGTPLNGLYGEAPPERGAFFKLAVYLRVGKIAILVHERVIKSAAKWKKRWL